MPLLRADDDAKNLRSPWLGPDESIRWPVDWTIQEWGVYAAVTVTVWAVVFPAAWSLWGALGSVKLEQLGLTLLVAGPAGPGCGWLAKQQVAPIINSDRRLSWLVACWAKTARALWWAHGPIDRGVANGATAAWVLTLPAAAKLPGPMLFWMAASAAGCVQGARWVRDRVESPDRHCDRTWARRSRKPVGTAVCSTVVTVDVAVRPDSCIPRKPYRFATRLRFIADLIPKGSL